MIFVAIMLSKLGHDKWDDVDRWLRNQLAANQMTDITWRTDGRAKSENWEFSHNQMVKGQYTTEIWLHHVSPLDTVLTPGHSVTCELNRSQSENI